MFTLKTLSNSRYRALKANGNGNGKSNGTGNVALRNRKRLIIEESGREVYKFIKEHVDICSRDNLFISTATRFNILNQEKDSYKSVVNLKRLNDIRRINKFLEAVNEKLPTGGLYIGSVETYSLRKRRILGKFPPVINWMLYTVDFIIKRVFPKIKGLQKIYFLFTRGNNRVLSKAETFGRLYSCGFELKEEKEVNGQLFFLVSKKDKPAFDYSPTYGPLIKLKRVGKHGKMIRVYKMRTMHAYSEYLQEYIFKKNNIKNGGKFDNDFRVTTVGRFMRKFWLDELPMLINWARGDMKLVGVRPLSNHYFNLYDRDLQEWRIKHRPGLIPPYYADMPETLEEIQESERNYLAAYEKHPLRTDWVYFWKAMKNIFLKNARSE